ncbi:MAG TPA: methyltransferase domain-containing protein [Bacteroidia bacterium]|jgi:SAM-dependent methyltransferase|nr:methyltransferase domain-containing protein [Bacteroidia bacterium]
MKCKVCGSTSLEKVNTYKHFWYACASCDSIEREKKSHYTFESFFPKSAVKKLPGYFTYLLPASYFEEAKLGTSYNYYADMGNSAEGSGTKWGGETKIVSERLSKFGVNIKDKSVLDVSGGPGFVANNLRSETSYMLLTEFSQVAVEGMRKFLAIDIEKYDYNSDSLDKITGKKFDIILVRFSINFCNDLEKFVKEAKNLLNPDGLIYVEHVEPNRGCLLRWQFDEYTYTLLHGIKTFAETFNKQGMSTIKQEVLFEEKYNKPYWNYQGFKIKVFYFFIRRIRDVYKMKMGNKIKGDLIQRSWVSIFKLN